VRRFEIAPPIAPGAPADVVEDATAGFMPLCAAGVLVDCGAGAEVVAVLEAAAGGTEGVGGVALVARPGPERGELGWRWSRGRGGEVGRVRGEGDCKEGRWGRGGELR